jgi:hypothetical protein
MEYRTGDHHGLLTRAVEIRPRCGDREDLLRYVVEPPMDYDPGRATERIRGPVTARIDAPPGARIAWFVAEGSFRTHFHEEARKTRNSIAWAAGRPEGFAEVYRSRVPQGTEHWHMNGHAEVLLPEPAETVFVRFVGDPALNAFHIYAHCLDDGRRSDSRLQITHVWKEKGELKTREVSIDGPGAYDVVTEDEPEDVSVEMAVPSAGRN